MINNYFRLGDFSEHSENPLEVKAAKAPEPAVAEDPGPTPRSAKTKKNSKSSKTEDDEF